MNKSPKQKSRPKYGRCLRTQLVSVFQLYDQESLWSDVLWRVHEEGNSLCTPATKQENDTSRLAWKATAVSQEEVEDMAEQKGILGFGCQNK